jgi:RNA polymerase sigma factor (sigma-70 family)
MPREGFRALRRYEGMESNSSDAELLARSVDEPALFAELYERHGQAVRRYVCRRVGDGPADDLASEVFVGAFRARGRYRAERDVALPWLLGIANNVIADHRRLERRRLVGLERLIRHAPSLVEHRDAGLAPELVAALRELPASERDTLLLVVWGELTQDEAAAALGVPVGTVSSRITRARERLVAALAPTRTERGAELRLNGEANV